MIRLSFLYTLATMALVYFGLEFISNPHEPAAFRENQKLLCTVLFLAPYIFTAIQPLLRPRAGVLRSTLETATAGLFGWGAFWALLTNTHLGEFQPLRTYFQGMSLCEEISVLAALWLVPLLILSRLDYLTDVARQRARANTVPR